MMSSPGNSLEVTSTQSEVNPRCGTKVSSPSRPQEASPSPRSPGSQGLKCRPRQRGRSAGEETENSPACRAWGQSGYVRPGLAAPRHLPEGLRAAGSTRFNHLCRLPSEVNTAAFHVQGKCSRAPGLLPPHASAAGLPSAPLTGACQG